MKIGFRNSLILGTCAFMMGCAKFPAVNPGASTRLIFTLRVNGAIRTGTEPGNGGIPYIYMVALRFSDQITPTTQGPIPVVSSPWGNGFVAGKATHFVGWDPTSGQNYLVYKFNNPDTLTEFAAIGTPITEETVTTGSSRIRFELELAQLFPNIVDRDALKSVQVNFLTMDKIPVTSGDSKQWDALGNSNLLSSVNDYVTIPLTINGTLDNIRSGNLEPTGDQPNPALDIKDWSIEVRRN